MEVLALDYLKHIEQLVGAHALDLRCYDLSQRLKIKVSTELPELLFVLLERPSVEIDDSLDLKLVAMSLMLIDFSQDFPVAGLQLLTYVYRSRQRLAKLTDCHDRLFESIVYHELEGLYGHQILDCEQEDMLDLTQCFLLKHHLSLDVARLALIHYLVYYVKD